MPDVQPPPDDSTAVSGSSSDVDRVEPAVAQPHPETPAPPNLPPAEAFIDQEQKGHLPPAEMLVDSVDLSHPEDRPPMSINNDQAIGEIEADR